MLRPISVIGLKVVNGDLISPEFVSVHNVMGIYPSYNLDYDLTVWKRYRTVDKLEQCLHTMGRNYIEVYSTSQPQFNILE